MKKIIMIFFIAAFSMSFKSATQIPHFSSIYVNSSGEYVGVDANNARTKYLICPGSGVACELDYKGADGEIGTIIGSKGKGRGNLEILY
jgi:hypothetical protein